MTLLHKEAFADYITVKVAMYTFDEPLALVHYAASLTPSLELRRYFLNTPIHTPPDRHVVVANL